MISLSYTITPFLKEHLKTIETLRRSILLTPLSPSLELTFVWHATVDRLWGTLNLSGLKVTKKLIVETLASPKKRPTALEDTILATKRVFDVIRHDWTGNAKPITQADVEEAATLLFPQHPAQILRDIDGKSRDLGRILSYLEVKPEHPVLAASMLHYGLLADPLSPLEDGRLARLLSGLVLAKSGYNVRSMIAPEAVLSETPQAYARSLASALRAPTITSWLEYYSKIILTAMERVADNVQKGSSQTPLEKVFSLNDRQKNILSLLENPATTVTNRAVSKRFRISQITASRDLAKLSSLGLLYPHGKGRSVYYTRV